MFSVFNEIFPEQTSFCKRGKKNNPYEWLAIMSKNDQERYESHQDAAMLHCNVIHKHGRLMVSSNAT